MLPFGNLQSAAASTQKKQGIRIEITDLLPYESE